MARVEFDNVARRFAEDTLALKNFSLNIDDGEFMVLVGPSGCGKSTALRLLAGLEQVSEGTVLIDGEVVNQLTPQQRNTAMVFQNYALYPHMSVRSNLEFPLKMAKLPKATIAEKVDEIAKILDLGGLLERKPKQLSGGQRQRVAMGRALVRDPSVFLLDEPLSNLDAKLRAQIRADIAQLQRRLRKTTLYVTHDQVEAMTLGDRVAVMNSGELQQVGSPEQLYKHPHNIFVARFIGSPGMNIVRSGLCKNSLGFSVQLGQMQLQLPLSKKGNDASLLQYVGQSIFIGVRPEALRTSVGHNETGIPVNVLSVEYLGHESLIYFELANSNSDIDRKILIARVEGQFHKPEKQEQLLCINPGDIYVFDSDGLSVSF